jgi:hypothetical protein
VETDIALEQKTIVIEEGHIYVHCHFHNTYKDMLIRIWKTTFLIDQQGANRAPLIHAENISFAPVWTAIPDGKTFSFLLIFGSLPKSCRVFDLVEEIEQPGGFEVRNIARNESDVYHVEL